MPKGECFLWVPELMWLHLLPDLFLCISFMIIPITLLYSVPKLKQVSYKWIFRMFAAFILGCGLMQLMDILTVWFPLYFVEGMVKIVTAAVSFSTAVLLIPLLPRAIELVQTHKAEETNEEQAFRIQGKI